MPWQSQDWVQDDSNFYGYPTPRLSDIVYEFDVNDIYCAFKIENNVFYGYPHSVFGVAPEFDVEKIYHYFQMNNSFYGYPAALGITYEPLGSFMKCTNLQSIQLPESVYELGTHSFFESGLQDVLLAPDCMYYNTTFPAGCTISYYPVTTTVSQSLDFTLGQDISNYLDGEYITVNNTITRSLINAYLDVDTSQLATDKTGYIRNKYTNNIIQTITYNVTSSE